MELSKSVVDSRPDYLQQLEELVSGLESGREDFG